MPGSRADEDLGSGGALLLPAEAHAGGTVRHLAVGAGKDQNIYLAVTDNMGKFNPDSNVIYQEIPSGLGGSEFGMPAYFSGRLNYGAVNDVIRALAFGNAVLSASPTSQTSNSFVYPGTADGVAVFGLLH